MTGNVPRGGGSRYLYEPFDSSTDKELREYIEIIRSMGSPEQVREKMAAIDLLIEERRRRLWLFTSIKTVASWAAIVAAGWMAFKGVMIEIVAGIQK
ncbi:MAG: hypothetical protein KDK03_17170 [Rhodobacteraceae bacterium]|uniref:hypothetical protein n=1 Tax=Amaricoccus sp. B4 TaxID=3368557 RepID=UPI000DADFCC6|nr:hypothetical protein [Paracoccaceae bacterium]